MSGRYFYILYTKYKKSLTRASFSVRAVMRIYKFILYGLIKVDEAPKLMKLSKCIKITQGPRYNFLLEGAMGKPGDELSDPEPWRGSRSALLEKI